MKRGRLMVTGCLAVAVGAAVLIHEVHGQNKPKRKIPFGLGEQFVYAVKFLGITAGIAQLGVAADIVKVNGRPAYHIVASIKAVPPFSWIHRFDDRVESFLDMKELYTLKLIKSIREGGYERDETLVFDQDKKIVKTSGGKTFEIPYGVQDFLSAFYYFRTRPIDVGKDPMVRVYADEKLWNFRVKIIGKETIKTILGKRECFIVKPIMQFEAVFKQRGDVTMWVTADEHLIPVYMRSEAAKGMIYATLTEIRHKK